ncbi:MAG TPA: hypothetical protein VHN15_02605 [Thermoanaerobaculia bacterium]|nr:hypothetical protein [Thermoanaerobaculia bacterium]
MQPKAIFEALAEEGVAYVLVGGLAATVHGASLTTLDTDVCFRQDRENCERLSRALERIQAEVYPPRAVPIPLTPELLQSHRILHLRSSAGRLDLLGTVPGLGTYDEIAPSLIEIRLEGLLVPVLNLDQLIQAKSVLNQPKDREHLDQLLAIRKLRNSPGS